VRRVQLPSRNAAILSAVGAASAAALMWLVLGLLVPSLVVGAMAGAAGLSLDAVRRLRRRGREREALVALVDLLVQLLAAGQSVRQALEALSKSGPTLLRPELQTIVGRQRQVSLEQALGEAQLRINQPLFTLTATALAVGSRSGGRLTPLLDELSRAAHQLEAVQRQLRAEQAQGRLGAMVIAAMPICLLVVLRVVNPEYLAPYASISGQLLLSLLLGLIVAGYLWMLWILRLPEPELKVLQPFATSGVADDLVEGSA
jgi:tight adherence protein B